MRSVIRVISVCVLMSTYCGRSQWSRMRLDWTGLFTVRLLLLVLLVFCYGYGYNMLCTITAWVQKRLTTILITTTTTSNIYDINGTQRDRQMISTQSSSCLRQEKNLLNYPTHSIFSAVLLIAAAGFTVLVFLSNLPLFCFCSLVETCSLVALLLLFVFLLFCGS